MKKMYKLVKSQKLMQKSDHKKSETNAKISQRVTN